MGARVNVFLYANDPVSAAGIAGQLRSRSEFALLDPGDVDRADVVVHVTDTIDDEATRVVRALQRNGCPRVVMVVTNLDDGGLMAAVEAGACGFLRRADTQPISLAEMILAAAAGDGHVPPDLLGRLLGNVRIIQEQIVARNGVSLAGLNDRETEVLRLLADGCDTAEVANRLAYSERTVKNVLQDVTRRLNLKNRTHAVAYALRQGLI
jgi:DNA-binding NarL/FixJ family response regulator